MKPFIANAGGLVIILVLSMMIRRFLAPRSPFTDFLKGDDGKYSLSRLQAALWAYVIISYQVSALIAVLWKEGYADFRLVFSEQVLWLLGLSLGGYITVKGITVGQQNASQATGAQVLKSAQTEGRLQDLITSDEGLDLSRFQMLIWTIIALVTFMVSYFSYVISIVNASGSLTGFFPEFSDDQKVLPSVDMSFIVLMGLSQGAYIGRKLVPSYKVDDFTQEYKSDLQTRKTLVDTAIRFRQNEYQLQIDSPFTPMARKIELQNELTKLQAQSKKMQDELDALSKS